MEQTDTYKLSQWEKTDRILMSDFNADNAKIETALSALATKDSQLDAAISSTRSQITSTFNSRLQMVPILETSGKGSSEQTLEIPVNGLLIGNCLFAILEVTGPASPRIYFFMNDSDGSYVGRGTAGEKSGGGIVPMEGGTSRFLLCPFKNPDATVSTLSLNNGFCWGSGSTTFRNLKKFTVKARNSTDRINGTYSVKVLGIK